MKTKCTFVSFAALSAFLIGAGNAGAIDRKTESSVVDSNGTLTEARTTSSESTNLLGAKKTTETESVTVDPKGLGNKVDASRIKEHTLHKNGDFEVVDKMQHADGTYEEKTKSQATAKHWTDSGSTVNTKETQVLDPKGLGNKKITEKIDTMEVAPDGSIETSSVTIVNGKKVAESDSK